jgi:hypothetical protein
MTRTYAAVVLTAVSLTLTIVAASQAAPQSLQERVQAAYDAQCSDLIAQNFAAFTHTLSPNFSASVNGRTITRDDVVLELKGFASQGRLSACATTIESVQESANVVIAVVNQRLDGTVTNGTQTSPVEIEAGKRDMWSDGPAGLQQTTSTSLWSLTYINGQLQGQTGTPPSTPPLELPSPGATP